MDTAEIVIILCVVIGAIAFLLVVSLLVWAIYFDRRNRAAFLANKHNKENKKKIKQDVQQNEKRREAHGDDDDVSSSVDFTSTVPPDHDPREQSKGGGSFYNKRLYPSEIGMEDDHGYPESVMSEDFGGTTASLSWNNQSSSQHVPGSAVSVGSSAVDGFGGQNRHNNHDGAESVSSFGASSYGYSLDGASLATPMVGDLARLDSGDSGNRAWVGGGRTVPAAYYNVGHDDDEEQDAKSGYDQSSRSEEKSDGRVLESAQGPVAEPVATPNHPVEPNVNSDLDSSASNGVDLDARFDAIYNEEMTNSRDDDIQINKNNNDTHKNELPRVYSDSDEVIDLVPTAVTDEDEEEGDIEDYVEDVSDRKAMKNDEASQQYNVEEVDDYGVGEDYADLSEP